MYMYIVMMYGNVVAEFSGFTHVAMTVVAQENKVARTLIRLSFLSIKCSLI